MGSVKTPLAWCDHSARQQGTSGVDRCTPPGRSARSAPPHLRVYLERRKL